MESFLADRSAKEIFFEHFNLRGGEPDLEVLRGIVERYSTIPYENLTKIVRKFTATSFEERLRRPVEVMSGYVRQHTGGTCFSLTFCLGSILSNAGYVCYPMMADMRRPNIHCALAVNVGHRRYLVDPGYLLGEPVELSGAPVTLKTSFGTVELRQRSSGTSYDLYTVTGGDVKWRYRVKTAPVSQSMFLRFWQESFSMPMMNSLQLTRLTGDGHLYIRNHHLRMRRAEGKLNENIRSELESRIEAEFGIPGSITAEAMEYLERMKKSWRIREQGSPKRQLR